MENITFNRQQLYKLVWSEPLLRLSKIYCISDNGLRKMCKTMNIPLPPNGYWQKIKYGKPVRKIQLPSDHAGKEEVILNPRTENCHEFTSPLSTQNILAKEIMSDKRLHLKVPDRLSSRPDYLITSTRVYRDAIRRYDLRRGGQYPERMGVLNISVSEKSLPRAYRILDTLIKLLRSRNHEVKVIYDKSVAVIEGEEIEFRLREKNRVSTEKDEYGCRILKPTGEFIFSIGHWYEKQVTDGKQKLESKIAIILAKMELEGKREHIEQIRREQYRKEREERELIEKEIRECKEAELKKFTDLFKEALQLHHASILRIYIEKLYANSDLSMDWMNWAMEKVNWYDPIVNTEDQLLDDLHKEIAFNFFMSLGK